MDRAEQIQQDMKEMELAYDNLFSSPDLMARYNALSAELRAIPAKPFNRAEHAVAGMVKAVRREIEAIRFCRAHDVSPEIRIAELCRLWPHYRDARHQLLTA